MANENIPEDMPLSAVVQAWLDAMEWDDEMQLNEDHTTSTVAATLGMGEDQQPHHLFIETDEQKLRIAVYLYSPYNCPPSRMDAMARILNRINSNMLVGRLACEDDGNPNQVQFRASMDFDGSEAAPEQIGVMASMATQAFMDFGPLLAAVAMTKRPVDELWNEAVQLLEAADAAAAEAKGPTEL